MGIRYEDLDEQVRTEMLRELERDVELGSVYVSSRLTEEGTRQWADLLREAFLEHDDDWIAERLRQDRLMRTTEEKRKPKGGYTTAQVPYNAPNMLAEGEFNRFYVRGLCAHMIAPGGEQVQVYRGKQVEHPRSASERMIGQQVAASELLEDLRANQGVDTALGLPAGPNSGLTVRRC